MQSIVGLEDHFLVGKMLKFQLKYTSIFLLMIVTIVGAMDKACYHPPTSNYSALIDCCQGSAITFSEEVMRQCSDPSHNSSKKKTSKELILMDICEIHCYLNKSGIIDDIGEVQREQLLEFLAEYLLNSEMKPLIRGSTDKCLRDVPFVEAARENGQSCQLYYSTLIDCIQKDIFISCPRTAQNSSELCLTCRSFVEYCGIGILQESYENSDSDESDYKSSLSESGSSESESFDYSQSSSESKSYSSSDSDSDYELGTESELEETTSYMETTTIL